MELFGTYAGTVEDTKDPEKIGRIKVRCPHVYGTATEVPTESLPWALPAGLPAGSNHGISWLPDVGDHVWVRFLDGEPEKPIWEWGMQDKSQAKSGAFQSYNVDSSGKFKSGNPVKSSLLKRYGHTIDMSPGSVIATTKYGYSLLLTDSQALQGEVALRTAMAQTVTLSDATQSLMILANQLYEVIYSNAFVSVGNLVYNVTEGDAVIDVVGAMEITCPILTATVATIASITSPEISLDANTSLITMVPASIDVETLLLNLTAEDMNIDVGNTTASIGDITLNTGNVVANMGQATFNGSVINLDGATAVAILGGGRTMSMVGGVINFT